MHRETWLPECLHLFAVGLPLLSDLAVEELPFFKLAEDELAAFGTVALNR